MSKTRLVIAVLFTVISSILFGIGITLCLTETLGSETGFPLALICSMLYGYNIPKITIRPYL